MNSLHRVLCFATGVALFGTQSAFAQPTKPLNESDRVSSALLVTRIDANCAVVKAATRTVSPSEVVASATTKWKAVPASDDVTLEREKTHLAHARIWKQAGHYVWVHWTSYDTRGNKHVDQFCFRSDGTLARVRQATTVPALETALGREAYYNRDGSLIKKTIAFDTSDPGVVYKHVRDLPFYPALR